jgi:nucleoside-diphosphate-sugar epimerase
MSVLRSSFDRAHHLAARLSSRFTRLDALEDGPRPGVLITGVGGKIGQILRAGLSDEYAIRGLDVKPGPGVDLVADMRKLERIERAFVGVQAVVDLAAVSREDASWDAVRDNNLSATLNAFEAARRAGVGRVVFASSNHVTGMCERDEPYASVMAGMYEQLEPDLLPRLRGDSEIRPDSLYAVGKAAGEAAARFYADEHGLSVICLRIGQVNLDDRPKNPGHFATLLTHRDLVHLIRCCLTAPPTLRFGIFYGVSANTWRIWDIEAARLEIGYEPSGNAESFR